MTTAPAPTQDHSRILALDGLRAVSILLVLVSHAGLGDMVPGGLGVTIFFFISGYIITTLLLQEFVKTGGISLKDFYIRRVFRIYPAFSAYIAVAAVYIFFVNGRVEWTQVVAALLHYYNYFAVYVESYRGELINHHPFDIVWSVNIEEHYYLVYPFLMGLLLTRGRVFLSLIAFLLVAILLWRIELAYGVGVQNLPMYRVYKLTDTRFDSILYGALLSLLRYYWPQIHPKLLNPMLIFVGGAGILLSLVLRDPAFRESWRYTLQGLSVFVMFFALIDGRNLANRILATPFMVYIGRISYSLYLWHWLVCVVVERHVQSPVALFAIACVASVAIADLSYRFIEVPGLAMRRRFLSH